MKCTYLSPGHGPFQDILLVAHAEIDGLGHAGDDPRDDIQQIQGRDGVEEGEHGVDPHHAEHARAHDDHDGGGDAAAQAAGGLPAEKVMSDALFKLAGDLSLQALNKKKHT